MDMKHVEPLVSKITALHTEIIELKALLIFARDNMTYLQAPPDPSYEYDFCDICNQPEWRHADNCAGVAWDAKVREALK